MDFQKEKSILESLGAENIKQEFLVNNYCYKFNIGNDNYILKHVVNVYGVSTNIWELMLNEETVSFDSLKKVVEHLKTQRR